MLTIPGLIGVLTLAVIEGAMVAAPRARALGRLERLRSPVWAAVLPGAIVVGTFAVIALPRAASALLIFAFVASPLLAALAAVRVVRVRFAWVLLGAVAIGTLAVLERGWAAQLGETLLTALGCLALGACLVRLIPRAWLPLGVLSMCGVDVLLLALGSGQPAGSLMSVAASHFHAPILDKATIGPITTDYPDLVLAGVLGSALGGHRRQWAAAGILTALVAAYGMLLPIAGTLPATVPIAVAFVLVRWGRVPDRIKRLSGRGGRGGRGSLACARPAAAVAPAAGATLR